MFRRKRPLDYLIVFVICVIFGYAVYRLIEHHENEKKLRHEQLLSASQYVQVILITVANNYSLHYRRFVSRAEVGLLLSFVSRDTHAYFDPEAQRTIRLINPESVIVITFTKNVGVGLRTLYGTR